MLTPPITRPSRPTLEWVRSATDARRVVRCRRMRGGIASVVHEVTVEGADGSLERVVLRRYTQTKTERDRHVRWIRYRHDFISLQVAGRAPVDLDGMCRRVDELLAAAVRRL